MTSEGVCPARRIRIFCQVFEQRPFDMIINSRIKVEASLRAVRHESIAPGLRVTATKLVGVNGTAYETLRGHAA